MNKRLIALLLTCITVLSLIAGCGSSSSNKSADTAAVAESYTYYEETAAEAAEPMESGGTTSSSSEGDAINGGGQVDLSEKIIYSMYAYIETMDFEGSVEKVNQLLERFGGFVESSSVSGTDLYSQSRGYTVTRYASYTLRIPSENYSGMTEALSEIGNVTDRSSWAENITTQYYDSQSRLNTYRTEEERLLNMLEKVDDVESMIAIEERLSEVRYQIESLETNLLNWQRQVDYSTVELSIQEVAELTEEKPIVRSYWQQVADGFSDSLTSIGRFFKRLFKNFISALPVLVVLAVVAVVVILIAKKCIKKRKAKKAMKAQKKPESTDDKENIG